MNRLINQPDKRVKQTLASGVIIRQDFQTSVRFVFFDTGDAFWPYATHGGTLFVVNYRGKPYGLTSRHILQDFNWNDIVITNKRHGDKIAGITAVYYPSEPKRDAVDTDLLDVAVIRFSAEITPTFFEGDECYIVDDGTVVVSKAGDTLLVSGALKEKSQITEELIAPNYCLLELQDVVQNTSDPTLRSCVGKFNNPEFSDVLGLSGSPVFNVTRSALCGLVVRGALKDNVCCLWYVDFCDIMQLLKAVHAGCAEASFDKLKVKS